MMLTYLLLAASVLTSVAELRQAEAQRAFGRAFDVEATLVSRASEDKHTFSVQDGNAGMTLWNHAGAAFDKAVPGDRIRIRGRLNPGEFYAIAADCTSVQILGHGPVPAPIRVTPEQLRGDAFTHCRIRLDAVVADVMADELNGNRRVLILSCGNALFYALVDADLRPSDIAALIGQRVAVTGIYSHVSGHRRQLPRAIRVANPDDIRVLDARTDPFDVADLGETDLFHARDGQLAVRRKATGRVLTAWGGHNLLLRTDGGAVVRGELAEPRLPSRGDRIALAGLPETDLYNAILTRAIWKRLPDRAADAGDARQPPVRVTSVARLSHPHRHQTVYDYSFHGQDVQLDGIVRGLPAPRGDGLLYLESEGRMATVDTGGRLPAAAHIGLGDTLRIRGTCVIETEKMGFNGTAPRITGLRIVLNDPQDVRVLARTPWWTSRRLLVVLGALAALTFGVVFWNLTLKKTVRRRSGELLKEQLAHAQSELMTRERTRMSVELHDTLSQTLLGATMEVNTAEQLLPADADGARRHLALASKTLASCRDELRQCLWDLRSRALEAPTTTGLLVRALEPYVHGLDLKIRFNVPRKELPDGVAHALLRIVRELVLNAVRHGQATSVRVAGCREDDRILFSVSDNGCGFDPQTAPGVRQGHFGLQGVRERLRLLHGEMSVESRPGAGAKISAALELPSDQKGTSPCPNPSRS